MTSSPQSTSTSRCATASSTCNRKGGVTKAGLDAITNGQSHLLKQRLFPLAAAGYLKFLAKRPQVSLTPPKGMWTAGDLDVRVKPEVALMIDGKPTVIKLYFKADELTRPRVQASIGVMEAELAGAAKAGTRFGVLDVRAGKLLLADGRWTAADTQILIKGEAWSFAEIWTTSKEHSSTHFACPDGLDRLY